MCLWGGKGDFNVVRHPGERLRNSRNTQTMMDFADFNFEQGLIDLPNVGGQITWSNWRAGSRLQIFFISTDWEEWFLEVCKKIA